VQQLVSALGGARFRIATGDSGLSRVGRMDQFSEGRAALATSVAVYLSIGDRISQIFAADAAIPYACLSYFNSRATDGGPNWYTVRLADDAASCAWLMSSIARNFFLAAWMGILLLAEVAGAQSDDAASIDFDIPVQSLASALETFSVTTGTVAVYDGELVAGRQSGRVRGRYTPEAALSLLLGDSGLVAQYTTKQAFVLVLATAPTTIVRTPFMIGQTALVKQDAGELRYSGMLQSSITGSLCARPETQPGDYRLAISFRVGPSGEITNLKLLSSTGDRQRDTAILGTLQHLKLVGGQPPASMAQPFTVIVLPRSSGGVIDCPASEGGRGNG
jgi:hypothetical protein